MYPPHAAKVQSTASPLESRSNQRAPRPGLPNRLPSLVCRVQFSSFSSAREFQLLVKPPSGFIHLGYSMFLASTVLAPAWFQSVHILQGSKHAQHMRWMWTRTDHSLFLTFQALPHPTHCYICTILPPSCVVDTQAGSCRFRIFEILKFELNLQ